jgi:hypothetical protein
MKLISMTDFVLENDSTCIYKYANLLKQPLELWMFVPCDENGDVLVEPKYEELCKYCPLEDCKSNSVGDSCEGSRCDVALENYIDEYQQAKERCLFLNQQGEVFDNELATIYLYEFFNIEQLSNDIRLIQLTQTAIKQLGL